MSADSTINNIPNISQLWDKSHLALSSTATGGSHFFPHTINKIEDLIIISVIVLFFIVAYKRIIDGFYYVFTSFYSTKKLVSIDLQKNIQLCKNTLFCFLTLCVSFMAGNITQTWSIKGESYTSFVIFSIGCCSILAYFFIKRVALYLLRWLHKDNVFISVFKMSITFAILNYTLIICGFIIYRAIESISPAILIKYSYICTFVSLFLYYVNGYKIFLSNGFSHFFYILYLCTLEILPLLVIWDIIYA